MTTWAFVLSFRRCHLGYATLAGVAAAAAVLTKYWSIFLVLALVIAALADPRRRIYFRSIAPWATALVGAVLIAPHLVWLVRENFPPLQWMRARRAAGSMAAGLMSPWHILGRRSPMRHWRSWYFCGGCIRPLLPGGI